MLINTHKSHSFSFPQIYINNEWYKSKEGKIFPSVNPATGQEIANIQLSGAKDVDLAVKAARDAFK